MNTATKNGRTLSPRNRLIQLALIILTSAMIALPSYAKEIYRWVDDNGEVHYSDRKPGAQKQDSVESLQIGTRKSSQKVDSRTRALDQAGELEKRKEEALEKKAEKLQAKAEDQRRDSNCQKAKNNLTKIAENARIKITGEDGQIRYLSQEEVEQRKKQYQEIVEASC